MRLLSIILIVLGIICVAVPSFTFFTQERAVDAGFFHIDDSKPHTIFLNPAVGALMLAAGVVMFLMGQRKDSAI